MGDASSIRSVLSRTDNSAQSIQHSAGAMMRLYDRSPSVAVTEWRDSLRTCRHDQLLPLLYVANEVLQTSKRNRGNKFLEAFSPVLSSSLQYICERDRSVVEKVRRTAKIWGDRRVFSVRFVGELLGGLEMFRDGGGASGPAPAKPAAQAQPPKQRSASPLQQQTTDAPAASKARRESITDSSEAERPARRGSGGHRRPSSPFSSPHEGGSLLDVDIKIDRSVLQQAASAQPKRSSLLGTKRSRPADDGAEARKKSPAPKPRAKVYSTQTLVDLLNRTISLDDRYRSSLGILASIPESSFSSDDSAISEVVGDELEDMYRQTVEAIRTVGQQRRVMHGIANERKEVEGEAVGYVPWLKTALRQDEEDMAFCETLEERLKALKVVHAEANAAREKRLDEEAREQALAEAERRRQEEEAERRRSLESAMKEPEPKPGMVWNKALREYQYLNTDENWRD